MFVGLLGIPAQPVLQSVGLILCVCPRRLRHMRQAAEPKRDRDMGCRAVGKKACRTVWRRNKGALYFRMV